MVFNSFSFLVFLPVVLAGHALLQGRALRYWLLIMSYVFYGWRQPWWYLALLFTSSVLDYTVTNCMAGSKSPRARKAWLLLSIVGNLGLLCTFKYLAYLANTANTLSSWLHLGFSAPVPHLPLPVGISFYTFQTMSYTIDVYRGRLPAEKNFVTMALFVAYFPQLVAGPIERAGNLMAQVAAKQSRSVDDILQGGCRVAYGLLKKVIFADWLAVLVNKVYANPGSASTWDLVLATYGFAFQIYLDFSAYSDIAIGSARMMGIHIMENFRWPYLSRTISEYWQRWHISLSTWLRDYLYFPLGGSRRGVRRTVLNVFIVMLLGGLWHGASHTFIFWGLWLGLGIALYHIYRVFVLGGKKDDINRPLAWSDTIPILITFHWMLMSRVFFRAQSIHEAFYIIGRFFHPWGAPTFSVPMEDVTRSIIFMGLTMLAHLGGRLGFRLTDLRSPVPVGAFLGAAAALTLVLFAPTGEKFIYFQF